jgi:hypothetical protein
MKKLLLLLPALSFLSFISFSAAKKTDLETENLKGKIKQVRQVYHTIEDKDGEDTIGGQFESPGMNYVIVYNEMGYVTDATYYVSRQTLESRNKFSYDAGGNRISEEWYNGDDLLEYSLASKYSGKGFLMESKKQIPESGFEKCIYETDPSGHPVKCTTQDSTGALIGSTTFKYDEYGNCIEEDFFNAKGKLTAKNLYQYDSRKLKTVEENYGADGSMMGRKKFTYEHRGRLSAQENFDNNGKLVEKNMYVYNDNKDEIEWTNYNRGGHVQYKYTYTYEYDAQGNWTKKTELHDGEAAFVALREISYY